MTQALQQLFVFWHVSLIPGKQWNSSGTPQYGHLLGASHITPYFLLVDAISIMDQVIHQWLSWLASLVCIPECYHFWLQFLFNLHQIMDMQFPKEARQAGHQGMSRQQHLPPPTCTLAFTTWGYLPFSLCVDLKRKIIITSQWTLIGRLW